ncbi:DUF2326 domain-containing protein [Enterococcus sp. ALS3]|uniref:DUF2326 domain-containing protein n=1 Tax=Enterococcus alishanensis TaxID=1303817 RepID=A0ABS6T9M4_9ENTE|nr:DUF2326 domain-containing protein [Enterococcus alishanensis]MBV7389604.1 DUF2326 domain-containing protein [Enterococcus alishanensis]
MYLKKLVISSRSGTIRDISFHLGVNLIVDQTVTIGDTSTGNNVGKTTVLKLIDFCLGAKESIIYQDSETKKTFEDVKDFLINEEIIISLVLSEDLLDESAKTIRIRRNFLKRNKKIMEVNGVNLIANQGKEFEEELDSLLIGDRENKKPSMRQILAHNIRYSDIRINNTLKMINNYTSLPEYEALFLFMFGIEIPDRAPYLKKLKLENDFKRRITKSQGKNELELQLSLTNEKLRKLDSQKSTLNINEHYEEDLQKLNIIKYQISRVSSEISELDLRKELILETEKELKSDVSTIDIEALREVYTQANSLVENVQKTFEDLVNYHNNMIVEKIRFIIQDIPAINDELKQVRMRLNDLLTTERELTKKIANSDTFQDLELIINEMNSTYQKKGELEKSISQIVEVEQSIKNLTDDIENIDKNIFSEEFSQRIYDQVNKFNVFFSQVSNTLYNEDYGITFDKRYDKKTQRYIYVFNSFNDNNSSGKKQGEIICFDLAYILFAREENIPKLDFILNDKKELMHGNQLLKIAEYAAENKIQLLFSILEDKLPQALNNDDNIVLRLSQEEKLFKIEN